MSMEQVNVSREKNFAQPFTALYASHSLIRVFLYVIATNINHPVLYKSDTYAELAPYLILPVFMNGEET